MMKRWMATGMLTLGLLVGLVYPAAADPANAKFAVSFPGTCNGDTVTIVVNFRAEGQWVAAFDANSTSVFVPTAFDIDGTFTIDGVTEPIDIDAEKPGNGQGRPATVTCSFEDVTFSPFPGASVTISGTATGFVTPAE
jgi:hypothetical protein